MAERCTVHQQATAGFTGLNNPITVPNITNENLWQIPSYIMTAINNSQFNGRDDEDAPAHLARLTRICGIFNLQGATEDAIFLQLFPFSLAGRAATWLDSHAPGSFTTWGSLMDAFLKKCSQHGLSDWALVEKFYNGLTYETRARFDTSAGGHLMGKRDVTERTDMFESFAQADVAAALEALSRDVKDLKMRVDRCEICRGGHVTSECLVGQEQANFVGGQGRFGLSYNSSWRNPQNQTFHSSSNPPGFHNSYPQNQGQGQPSGSSGSSSSENGGLGRIEELLTQLVAKDATTQKILHEHDVLLKNQKSAFLDFQRTVGDIAKRLDERPQGQFPSQPQTNPNAHVKAVTTCSGRSGGDVFMPPVLVEADRERVVPPVVVDEEEPVDEEIEMETPRRVPPRLVPASTAPNSESPVKKPAVGKPVMFRPTSGIDLSHVPYPARLTNQKHSKEYGHFLHMFKQLKINLPFIEALQHIPKYVKYLKELLNSKDRLGEVANTPVSSGCSAVILNKLPLKLADPGMFTITCLFGDDVRRHALADLGASINLMPYSLYEKLALGDLSPTRMTLSLADRSVKCPRGILKNILVKVDSFVFPVDFVVMDMEADTAVPSILGRPFLSTAKAIIDVFEGKLTLRVGDESVCLKIADFVTTGGKPAHIVDGLGVDGDEFVEEGPWDVGDRVPDVMAREEIPIYSPGMEIWKLTGKRASSRHATPTVQYVALREGMVNVASQRSLAYREGLFACCRDLMCMFVVYGAKFVDCGAMWKDWHSTVFSSTS
ncbi:hypothetical protein E3N88_07219 [Mikania micrantha]|uniref:Retrotransposon gag domain-containing protein n=1 Tax=Mikania micrantha TaxID=192012 RepID=A0A5N6PQY1_9ASTR|nr:hypothetical protein E3N88_07219 [Mikania micrantha]